MCVCVNREVPDGVCLVESVIPEYVPDGDSSVRLAIRMSMTACCGAWPQSAPCWGPERETAGRSAGCTG